MIQTDIYRGLHFLYSPIHLLEITWILHLNCSKQFPKMIFPSFTKLYHHSSYSSISPTRPELSLAGKTVVVTGGGAGIGAAIAQSVALAGASKIAIIGRRHAVLDENSQKINSLVGDKTQVLTVVADVSSKEQIEQAFFQITQAFGDEGLHMLVNNAAFFTGIRPFGSESTEDWTSNFNVNVLGPYHVTTAFIANAGPKAVIVNVSSASTQISPVSGLSSYATTKLAGAKLMDYVQKEYPLLHVVNVHPGQVRETEGVRRGQSTGELPKVQHIDDGEIFLSLHRTAILTRQKPISLVILLCGWLARRRNF